MRVIFQAICFMLNIHLIYISISPSPPCSCHSTLKENFLLDINWLVPLKHATGSVFLELVLSHSTNGSSKREISIEIDSLLHILQHHHIAIFEKFFNFFKNSLEEEWRNSCSHFHSRLEHTWLQPWLFPLILLSSLQTLSFWDIQVQVAEMFIIILQIFVPVCCSSRELAG